MRGFCSVVAVALCLNSYTLASPALPLFNIVRFKNEPCKSSSTREGTCYTAAECENLGGSEKGDSCAEGFGVCCEFSDVKCGDTSRQNNTYLIQSTVAVSSSCTYTICPANENICRIKFLFTALTLAEPTSGTQDTNTPANTGLQYGACVDSFKITGGSANGSPVICGVNTGQHMILDSDGSGDTCHHVNINVGSAAVTRSWDIRVTQYDCKDMTNLENTAGPKGCLQYHLGSSTGEGRIDNFNYVGASWPTTIGTTGVQHLINQEYNICIRRHAQMTRICYDVAAAINHFGLSVSSAAISLPVQDNACTTDYITIPGGRIGGNPAIIIAARKVSATQGYKFCGRFLNTDITAANAIGGVCSYVTPFVVGVNFDDGEVAGNDNMMAQNDESRAPSGFIGFHLKFTQDAPAQA